MPYTQKNRKKTLIVSDVKVKFPKTDPFPENVPLIFLYFNFKHFKVSPNKAWFDLGLTLQYSKLQNKSKFTKF